MLKKILLAFVTPILLALAPSWPAHAQEPPDWFALSFLDIREDVAEATKQGKRLMIYFHQDGCPYCKRLVEVNFRDPKIVEAMRTGFVSIDINIFGSREVTWTDGRRLPEKDLAGLLKIQFTPTLVFFDERAEVAHRINGYLPPEPFLAALGAARGAKLEPGSASGAAVDLRRPEGSPPLAVMLVEPACADCDEARRHMKRESVRRQLERFELVTLRSPAAVRTQAGRAVLTSSYVPTFVFIDAGGREVFRTESYLRPFELAGALEYIASGSYQEQPSFQRFLLEKIERMRSRGEHVDLWN